MNTNFDTVAIGDELPVLHLPAVDRTTLALFAGASGDHNPIHIDLNVARRSGMPDVFAQGMLGMAWVGRLMTGWVPQSRLRSFDNSLPFPYRFLHPWSVYASTARQAHRNPRE